MPHYNILEKVTCKRNNNNNTVEQGKTMTFLLLLLLQSFLMKSKPKKDAITFWMLVNQLFRMVLKLLRLHLAKVSKHLPHSGSTRQVMDFEC